MASAACAIAKAYSLKQPLKRGSGATGLPPYTKRRYERIPRPGKEASMRPNRFGSKIKLPSTVAIKHQLLIMMLEDEIRAIPAGGHFKENESTALRMLGQLKRPNEP
jgi:hypothetical protein